MIIVGRDFHPEWQQLAVLDVETGEITEHKLVNGNGEAARFYRRVTPPALIGIEPCGNSQWFIELLERLGHEVWIGDAAQFRASYVRKQRTERRGANHTLQLLVEDRFPRLWIPSAEQRDLRQLLIHRHKLVSILARVKGGLQHLALNRVLQKKSKLWSVAGQKALRELPLESWSELEKPTNKMVGFFVLLFLWYPRLTQPQALRLGLLRVPEFYGLRQEISWLRSAAQPLHFISFISCFSGAAVVFVA